MPAIGFLAMAVGGVIVWAGYLGESIPTVTKAILNGDTSKLLKQPIDPTKLRATTTPQNKTGGGGTW